MPIFRVVVSRLRWWKNPDPNVRGPDSTSSLDTGHLLRTATLTTHRDLLRERRIEDRLFAYGREGPAPHILGGMVWNQASVR